MSSFDVDSETLYGLVSDGAGAGLPLLESLGGVRGVAKRLRTDLVRGRPAESAEELGQRQAAFSTNELPPAEEVTFTDMVLDALGDRMLQLLLISAAVSLVLGLTVADPATGAVDYAHGWMEGAAILLSVAIVTIVSSLNNYQKELKFKELVRTAPQTRVTVVRVGIVVETTDRELLVGDLLKITGGDVLTVDGIVVHSNSLKVDESAATGENDDVPKDAAKSPFLLSGSNVVEGDATMLVTGVGVNSFAGRISMQVRKGKEETPLQKKLSALADRIGNGAMIAAGFMFILMSLREWVQAVVLGWHPLSYKPFLDSLTAAVTIVVVAVPEGLPLSVTIALAYSMKQMFLENTLVRHLVACETMGSATTICTDKTGTITQNKMSVTDVISADGMTFVLRSGEEDKLLKDFFARDRPGLHALLTEGIAVNSTACRRLQSDSGGVRFIGNKTEQALLTFVDKLGEDSMEVRAAALQQTATSGVSLTTPTTRAATEPSLLAHEREVHTYPFSSARKRMTTAMVLRRKGIVRYHVKGASELVLADCANGMDASGRAVPLRHAARAAVLDGIMDMSRRRLRTIAVAYAEEPLPGPQGPAAAPLSPNTMAAAMPFAFPATDGALPPLTLMAVLGIRDPVRPEVPRAVAQCKRAGISLRLITGDNKATAVSIAKEVGIYGKVWSGPARGEQGLALEGYQFREFAKSARKLNQILPRLQVISRASPLDKQILVAALMERGEVVAVTGDGTNDAPALKNAHVGFSMNTGTEVAKSASDIVILDDNFSTIVTAIKWGRNIHNNISKFLQFQMTVNVAAVAFSFIGAIFSGNGESPLKPVQLMWLNLIMDTLAALALATESPREDVLDLPPRGREAPLISQRMWTNIFGQALYQILLQFWVLYAGHNFFNVKPGSEEHLTVVFNVFVLLQLFNEFNARVLDEKLNIFAGLSRAPLFLLVVGLTFVVQVIGVQYGGQLMRAVPLTWPQWLRCFLVALIPLPLGLFLRLRRVVEPALPPPPVVRDAEEEARIAKAPPAPRLTLREAARRVVTELKVTAAFAALAAERKR